MKNTIWNINLLFKFINRNYLQNIVESIEIPRGKVRSILGLSAPMNKISFITYLISDKDSLIVSDSEIKGVHGLPLDINSILGQFKRVIKNVKCWCGDNDIIDNFTPNYFLQVIKCINERENDHEIRTKIRTQG